MTLRLKDFPLRGFVANKDGEVARVEWGWPVCGWQMIWLVEKPDQWLHNYNLIFPPNTVLVVKEREL